MIICQLALVEVITIYSGSVVVTKWIADVLRLISFLLALILMILKYQWQQYPSRAWPTCYVCIRRIYHLLNHQFKNKLCMESEVAVWTAVVLGVRKKSCSDFFVCRKVIIITGKKRLQPISMGLLYKPTIHKCAFADKNLMEKHHSLR